MPPASAAAALNELSRETFRLTSRLNALADRIARDSGMSSARWQVLGSLASEGPMSVAEIARRMGLQRQSVQRTADCLAADGCISFQPNPRHRRAKLAVISEAGESALKRLQQDQQAWVASIEPELQSTRLRATTEALRELREIIEARHNTA